MATNRSRCPPAHGATPRPSARASSAGSLNARAISRHHDAPTGTYLGIERVHLERDDLIDDVERQAGNRRGAKDDAMPVEHIVDGSDGRQSAVRVSDTADRLRRKQAVALANVKDSEAIGDCHVS